MKMNWRTVAVISLSLNVGVAFWVGRLRRPPQLGVPAPLTPPLLTALPTPQPVPGSMARTNQPGFHWRELESADYQAYAIEQDYSARLVQAVGRLFADPQQDPQPLRDIAREMESRLAAALGPEAASQLDRLGVLPRLVVQDGRLWGPG